MSDFDEILSSLEKPPTESFDEIISALDDSETELVFSQIKRKPVSEVKTTAKRGALVISVEGETTRDSIGREYDVALLGYLISVEETGIPNHVRVRFSSMGKDARRNEYHLTSPHGNIEKVVESPLSISGNNAINPYGYIVHKKNGLRILENGEVVLVSRRGIFAGSNGWALAEEYLAKWREEALAKQHIEEEYYHLVAEYDRLEQQVNDLKLELADLREKEIWYQKNLTDRTAELEDLHRILITYKAKLPALAKQNSTLLAENERMVSELLTKIEQIKTAMLKLGTIEFAYMVEDKLPQELVESTIGQEKRRMIENEIIEEGEENEEPEESGEGTGGSGEGSGGNNSGEQRSEEENREHSGQNIHPALPSPSNKGKITNKLGKLFKRGSGKDTEEDEDEEREPDDTL